MCASTAICATRELVALRAGSNPEGGPGRRRRRGLRWKVRRENLQLPSPEVPRITDLFDRHKASTESSAPRQIWAGLVVRWRSELPTQDGAAYGLWIASCAGQPHLDCLHELRVVNHVVHCDVANVSA